MQQPQYDDATLARLAELMMRTATTEEQIQEVKRQGELNRQMQQQGMQMQRQDDEAEDDPVDLPDVDVQETVPVRTRALKTEGKDSLYRSRGKTDNLAGLYRQMDNSRKFRKTDSGSYTLIKGTLGNVNTQIDDLNFSEPLPAVQQKLGQLSTDYTLLVNQSREYMKSHVKPYSHLGKYRKFLVGQIEQFANEDQMALLSTRDHIAHLSEEERGRLTLGTLFQQSRAREIREDRDNIHGSSSGAMSEVLRVEVNDVQGVQERRFFKVGHSLYSEEEKNEERDKGMAGNLRDLGATIEGGYLNAEKRNIATTVLAKLLRLDGLVVESELAKRVPVSGIPQYGVLMEEAKGMNYDEIFDEQDELKMTPQTQEFAQAVADPDQLHVLYKNLTNLQILDVICGQVDRHLNNFKVEVVAGQIVGVHGFDNDMAFGTTEIGGPNDQFSNDAMLYNRNGEIILPHVSRELAERIVEISNNLPLIESALIGLLSAAEINAVKARVTKMGSAMREMIRWNRTLTDAQWTPAIAQQVGQFNANRYQSVYEMSYFDRYYRAVITDPRFRQHGGHP